MSKLLGTHKITSRELFDPDLRMWQAAVFVNGVEVAAKWFNRRTTAIAWINAVVARHKAEQAGAYPAGNE